jgi:PAS domain S-box-containing protein
MTFSIERKVAGGFACALALLSVIGIVSYLNVARWRDAAAQVKLIETRLVILAAVPGKLSEVASAEQAYQLTGAEKFSRLHAKAVSALAADLEQLSTLSVADPGPQAGLDALRKLCRESAMKPLQMTEERSAADEAQQAELHGRIRRAVAAMLRANQVFLGAQEQRVSQSATVTEVVVIVGTVLAFGLVGWTLLLLKRDFVGRRQAEELLRRINDELEARVQDRTAALRQTNESLRASEGRLAGIIGSAMDGIITVDDQQRILLFNAAAEKMFGYPAADLLGQPLNRLIPERFQKAHTEQVGAFGRTHVTRRSLGELGSLLGLRSTGEEFPIEASISQIESGGQKLFTVILRDITERKLAAQALQASLARLETAQELAQMGSFEVDLSSWHVHASRPMCRLLGMNPESPPPTLQELIEFVHPEDRVHFVSQQRRPEPGDRVEAFDFRSNPSRGSLRYFAAVFDLVTNAEGVPTGYTGTILDITERKQAEAGLRESEERLRQITSSLRDAIWLVEAQTQRVLYVNQSFERICGRTCAEFYQNPDAFNELIHPDDKDRVLRAYFNGASVGALEERHRIVRPDGEVRWVQGRTVPVKNEAGETYRIASLLEDVTKRVEAERLQRSLEEQLRQAQKMEAIGTLAGGIAHDFNNVLAGILGSAELARMEVPADHPAQQFLQPIFLACHRARDLVQQILTFSRRRGSEKMLLELQPIVSECVKLLRSTIPAMVKITFQVDSNCGPVRADPSQVHQVIMNICTNAWHALPPNDGHIDVTLAGEFIGDEAADRHPDLRPGEYVRLSVTDNGHGMDAATQQRIFEPFFTTKPSGQGTGLGLSVVHGIIKAHQGAIVIQSEPGKGSTFHIYLPAQTATQAEAPTPPKALAQGAGQRILFVDDEQNLAAVTEKVLTRIGYAVTRCCQSDEALERFRRTPADFDLLITDLAMPGMSGTDLAAAVLQMRANIPIVLISGFVDPAVRETAHRIGIREVLHKPFAIETLSEAVGRALAGVE